jgi:hypothetical protein
LKDDGDVGQGFALPGGVTMSVRGRAKPCPTVRGLFHSPRTIATAATISDSISRIEGVSRK